MKNQTLKVCFLLYYLSQVILKHYIILQNL